MKIGHLIPATLVAFALAACGAAPTPAHDEAVTPSADAAEIAEASGITIDAPWIRQPPPSAPVAGGYLRIDNHGPAADRLLAVETDAAARVEIHEMSHVDGVMRMRQLPDGLEIPAGGHAELAPGAEHLMLIDPQADLTAGQQVHAVLVFEHAGRIEVTFQVRAADGAAADDHHGHHEEGSSLD